MLKITEKNGIVKWEDEDCPCDNKGIFCDMCVDSSKMSQSYSMVLAKNINLLPKESTMKTRYAVVNLKEKEEFEKKWEMGYGYNNCPYIGFSQKEAINWINRNLGQNERKDYVVERHNAGKIDVVWKIIPGQKLAGEQEDDEFDEDL
jgi:hypothetical protein